MWAEVFNKDSFISFCVMLIYYYFLSFFFYESNILSYALWYTSCTVI